TRAGASEGCEQATASHPRARTPAEGAVPSRAGWAIGGGRRMAHLTDYKTQRWLTSFPWRRGKPRSGKGGSPPIEVTTREGQRLWADAMDLVQFADPGPALVCVAMHGDGVGNALLRGLLVHHARERGVRLPASVPEATTVGL